MNNSRPFISSLPSKKNAILARAQFFSTTIGSLAYLKGVYEEKFGSLDFTLEPLLYARRNASMLDPNLFFLHDGILMSMRNQEINRTRYLFGLLANQVKEFHDAGEARVLPTVESIGGSEWERSVVNETVRTVQDDLGRQAELRPVSDGAAKAEYANIRLALDAIKQHFPEMSEEIAVFLNCIRVFEGRITMGITDVRMFGCMFARTPREDVNPALYYGEHICHEVSHMYLNAAMSIDPIVLNSRDERHKSPIRPDPRPMIGVFHATFVTSRIVQFFDRLSAAHVTEERLVHLEQQLTELADGIDEIEKHGRLTAAGEILLKEFRQVHSNALGKPYWSDYVFDQPREHRFGGGVVFRASAQADARA